MFNYNYNHLLMTENKSYIIQFDGGSRGNPGIAGCGFVIYTPNGEEYTTGSVSVGNYETNNVAEYLGLLYAIKTINNLIDPSLIKHLLIQGDSLLVINQIKGLWKIKAEKLIPINKEIKQLLSTYDYSIEHIPRKQNKRADELANLAMDKLEQN